VTCTLFYPLLSSTVLYLIASSPLNIFWLALPAGGNSYNQLAVLCSYETDDLGAVFFYIR